MLLPLHSILPSLQRVLILGLVALKERKIVCSDCYYYACFMRNHLYSHCFRSRTLIWYWPLEDYSKQLWTCLLASVEAWSKRISTKWKWFLNYNVSFLVPFMSKRWEMWISSVPWIVKDTIELLQHMEVTKTHKVTYPHDWKLHCH